MSLTGVVLSANGEFVTAKLLVNKQFVIVEESKVVVAFDSLVQPSIAYLKIACCDWVERAKLVTLNSCDRNVKYGFGQKHKLEPPLPVHRSQ